MVEWLGSISETDALTMSEVEEITEQWHEEPPIAVCVRHYVGVKPVEEQPVEASDPGTPREITEEEWQRICEREKAYAAEQNGKRNPFL